MKKTYDKPVILFDDFSLSTTIAAGCEFTTNLQGDNVCGYPTRNGVVFTSEVNGCEYHEPDTNDSLCYHVPNDYANIFNS